MKLTPALLFVSGAFAAYPLALLKQSLLGQADKLAGEGRLANKVTSTLETATVQIKNNFPIGAWFTILHWRGSPKEEQLDSQTFSNVSSEHISDYMGVAFDTERKDFDIWSVGVHFGNPALTLWTENHEANFALADAHSNSVFETKPGTAKVDLSLPRSSTSLAFEEPGHAHPAPELDSFVFFTPITFIEEPAKYTIELVNDGYEHDLNQTFTYDSKAEPKEGYHFPSYFSVKYPQTWTISVHDFENSSSRKLRAKFTCNLKPEYIGWFVDLLIKDDGYEFGYNLKRSDSCKGKWEK